MARWNAREMLEPASRAFEMHPPRPDPYARWAERTDWRGYCRTVEGTRMPSPTRVRILARAETPAHLRNVFGAQNSFFEISPLYDENGSVPGGDGQPALHFTATVPRDRLAELDDPHYGLRWELAVPLREAQTLVEVEEVGRFGSGERDAEQMLAREVLQAPAQKPPPIGAGAVGSKGEAVVAVVDYGAPFLHVNFQDGKGRTRIRALWDQDRRFMRSWWAAPPRAGYGRELSAAAIQAMLEDNRDADRRQRFDEAVVYRTLDYLIAYRDPRRRVYNATHGAHVLDMAGGQRDPLIATPAEPKPPARNLVFVQLPAMTAADSSGGSLGAQLLDAVRYVLDVCHPEAKVVVNISYGSAAGSHDGSSLTESALDELLERRGRNFAIVLAAGNSRRTDTHAHRVASPERSARLRLALEPGDSTDTFVELWYPQPKPYAPVLGVRVRTPQRDWSDWVRPGEEVALLDERGEVTALLQHRLLAPGSLTQSMALLATAPTAAPVGDPGPLAEAGLWEIEVRIEPATNGRDVAAGESIAFDAWVERDDPGDLGIGAQPRFVDLDDDDQTNTLSSIATGAHTVVVGGYRIGGARPVDYGSRPALAARGRHLPFVLAACEEDAQDPDIRAAAVRSTETYRMNGTSVAAPVVARRLSEIMESRDVDRADWPAILLALARDETSFVRLPPEDW